MKCVQCCHQTTARESILRGFFWCRLWVLPRNAVLFYSPERFGSDTYVGFGMFYSSAADQRALVLTRKHAMASMVNAGRTSISRAKFPGHRPPPVQVMCVSRSCPGSQLPDALLYKFISVRITIPTPQYQFREYSEILPGGLPLHSKDPDRRLYDSY
jgi:hypothetical protein